MKKNLRKSAALMALVAGSLLASSVAFADEQVQSFDLDEMIITATRTPVEEFKANASVNVVTRKQLENKHYTSALDALRDVPGVTIAGYGNTGEVYSSNSLILNGSDKIVVLIDGIRANINGSASTYGKMNIQELTNMDSIERIEVLKSSASTLYGADAAGGVINIITRKPVANSTSTKVTVAGGSYSKELYRLNHRGATKEGTYWEVSLQKKLSGNFKDGDDRMIPEHLNSENNAFKVGHKFGEKADINVTYQTYKTEYLRPTGGYDKIAANIANNAFNTGERNNSKLNFNYNQKFSEKVENTLSFYRHKHQADEITFKSNLKDTQPYIYHYSTLGFSDQVTVRPDKNNTIVAGVDWYRDAVDDYMTSASSKYSDKKTVNRSAFVNEELKFADTWNLSAGIRYNDDSNYGSKWLPSVVLGNTPNDKVNYYIGYKKFFVAPYPSQLYGQYGTPNLNPESGAAIEAGANYRIDSTTAASAHVFRRKTNDSISYDSGTKKYINNGEEDARGFDLQLRKNFGKFSTNAAYTYTYIKPVNGKNANSDGRIPRGMWNIGVDYSVDKFNAGLTARGTIAKEGGAGNSYGGYNNSPEASDYHTYWLIDINVNYKPAKNVNIYGVCRNLFDRLYTEQRACLLPYTGTSWYSAPGRNFEVGVEFTF